RGARVHRDRPQGGHGHGQARGRGRPTHPGFLTFFLINAPFPAVVSVVIFLKKLKCFCFFLYTSCVYVGNL
uniref:Uncharacterized protein n=1 Tax=Oryctolagus cuniculus TaxID=9986 RepID=A0A5F9CB99_RABIT